MTSIFNQRNIRKEKIKKILIFGPNWVGDAIMSTPMVSSLKKVFPDAIIIMVVKPYVYSLWKTNTSIDEIWTFKAPKVFNIFAYLKLFWRIKKYHFDLTIILPHYFRYAFLALLSGINYRIGYNVRHRGIFLTHSLDYNHNLRKKHMVENYSDILRVMAIEPENKRLTLTIDFNNQIKAKEILEENNINSEDLVIGLAPGAIYGPAKRWPKERYAEIADKIINEYQAKVIIFIGPMERALGYEIEKIMFNKPIILNCDDSLLGTAALIKRCNLFITNDSGLMHIAAAVKTKIIAIFGSTSSDWTGPYGNGHIVVKKPIVCSPCFKRKCQFKTYDCLKSISIEAVLGAVDIQLKRKRL